jgi:hypothetical protein
MPKKKSATNDQPPATNDLVTTVVDTLADPGTNDQPPATNDPDAETDALEEVLLQDAITHHGITAHEVFAYRIDLQARAVTLVTVDARKLFYPTS